MKPVYNYDALNEEDAKDCSGISERGVIYFPASIKITGGSGTSTDPYTLGL